MTGIAKPLVYNTTRAGVERGELEKVSLPGGLSGFRTAQAASEPLTSAASRHLRAFEAVGSLRVLALPASPHNSLAGGCFERTRRKRRPMIAASLNLTI